MPDRELSAEQIGGYAVTGGLCFSTGAEDTRARTLRAAPSSSLNRTLM
jgi:hypothetical protein